MNIIVFINPTMQYIYTLEQETAEEQMVQLSQRLKHRRLEKGLSRAALSQMSGVPAPTIAKFEQSHTIALSSFVALAQALGHIAEIKNLLSQPNYSTMEELEIINSNKNRKRGRR